jgi:glycosyltransferase involved in cell wall biosynthesis
MCKLYIVIPAYNEEKNIAPIAREWHEVLLKISGLSRLVIINDGSTDDTQKILESLRKELPQMIPLVKTNGGHGSAVLFGYKYALENGADYIFQTDSDGQTLSSEFWCFWEERKNYSLVLGHRKFRGDGLVRWCVTKVLKLSICLFFHVSIPDANVPFRLFSAKLLQKYIKMVPGNYFLANTLLTVIYCKSHESVKFIPITFRDRQGGKNSINISKICKIGLSAPGDFVKQNKEINSFHE